MKIGVVQMDVTLAQKAANLAQVLARLRAAAAQGVRIVIFPECALTGYCFDRLAEASALAEEVPGPSTLAVAEVARELGCTVVMGMLEAAGSRIYNAAVVISPSGILGTYRKIHLPHVGLDRFVAPGDRPFQVFNTPHGKLGVNICYDLSFPEAGRVLKLGGAQLLAVPTNWPVESDLCSHVVSVRAMENHMAVAASDRVGEERGYRFAGRSQIADPTGKLVADAGATEEIIVYAEVDLESADRNRLVRRPGVYEIDRIADRRPEMYGAITEPVTAGAELSPSRHTRIA